MDGHIVITICVIRFGRVPGGTWGIRTIYAHNINKKIYIYGKRSVRLEIV